MALRPFGRKDSIMSIEIDKDKFRGQIRGEFSKFETHLSSYFSIDKLLEYGDAVLDTLQGWLDLGEWKENPEIDTLREVRILMRLYIVSELKPTNQSWFVPNKKWVQVARQMSVWTVKKVAEEYWGEMVAEKGLPPKD